MPFDQDIARITRRMVKKADILTRPTPARQDAPFHGRGRSKREGEAVHTTLCVSQRLIGRSPSVLTPLEKSTKLADCFSILPKVSGGADRRPLERA